MSIQLPDIITEYMDASNQHNIKSIMACFSDLAVVYDEGEEFSGRNMVEAWLLNAIEQYQFQFKPLSMKKNEDEIIVDTQVSGKFEGSPVILQYHFKIEDEKISSLTIS